MVYDSVTHLNGLNFTNSNSSFSPLNQGINELDPVFTQVRSLLSNSASLDSASNKIGQIFGTNEQDAINAILFRLSQADPSLLGNVSLLDSTAMNGARGVYASSLDQIYLNQSLLGNPGLQDDSLTGATGVLIEEIGHRIDTILNPGADTVGDEGELFKCWVLGINLSDEELVRIKAEDDSATININGLAIAVEQDNFLSTARAITVGSTTTTYQDWVGSSDTNDYYRFTLANTSNFNLSLTGMTADADVRLLNSAGSTITSSTSGGSTAESISRQLGAGTYYVQVFPYSTSNTSYNLSLAATPTSTITIAATDANAAETNLGQVINPGQFALARTGSLTSTLTANYTIGGTATNGSDYSSLTGSITFAAGSSTAFINLNVINDSLVESNETVTLTLSSSSAYQIGTSNTATVTIADNDTALDYAGNSLTTARAIIVGSATTTYQDWVGSSDTNDYYRFTLANTSNFNLSLTGMTADADVQLLNSSGSTIASSGNSGSASESIIQQLASGTYYVRVFPYSGSTYYNLNLSATPISTPPPDFSSVYGYGLINAAAAVARAVGQTISFPEVPNLGGNNWGNDLVKAPEVWNRGYTGQGIVVAVVDTGVDYTHPDLDANIWVNSREIAGNGIDDDRNGFIDDIRGWDFVNNDNNPLDRNGHGTHVAGTIAGENNGFGVTGVAYNTRIMPVQVLGDSGGGSSMSVANGIRYAANNGAHVINLSLGGGYSADIYSAIQYASNRGSIVVMAAGNNGSLQPGHPAFHATEFGLSVGAVDSNSRIASFSNRAGSNSAMQHVVAPGVNVYSTTPNNTYRYLNGTSMATPHVAGVVALILSANRNLTPSQVRSIVTSSAVRLSANAGVQSLSSFETVISPFINTGSISASITQQLGSGTYYAQVFPDNGSTYYNLNPSSTPVVPLAYVSNSFASAPIITIGSSTTTYQDWVGSSDTSDYYPLSLETTSNFNLSLTSTITDSNVQLLLDTNGQVLASSDASKLGAELITRSLGTRTY
jgi:subtilisin family serine protease